MTIVRFNLSDVFSTDSSEYDILYKAVKEVKDTEGAVVEIGTRRGGSALIIIDALKETNNTNRSMFCIDPYGNIDYECTNKSISVHNPNIKFEGDPESLEDTMNIKLDYTNNMRNRIIPSLYYYAYDAGLNFNFFCLEDTEFFNRYSDGVPVYNDNKTLLNKYAFVFFDGPHTNETIKTELDFFLERTSTGSVFVFDDIWMMDHDRIVEERIFELGWKTLEKGKIKASYVRT